tara:strand:+ start:574 stop:756 length:183 start_codon:yes stop_codon:yes gene_type:complete
MAKETLQQHLNRKLKEKGTSLAEEKKKAGKYKSIGAAKKQALCITLTRTARLWLLFLQVT